MVVTASQPYCGIELVESAQVAGRGSEAATVANRSSVAGENVKGGAVSGVR